MGVKLEGWERLRKALKEFAEKFDREISEKFAKHIIHKSIARIEKGEIKPPTSSFTLSLRRKGKGKGQGQTLLDTGRLMNSLTYQLEGRRMIKIGSNLPYAKVHQFGATIKPKKAKTLCIPATKEVRKKTLSSSVREVLEDYRKKGYQIWFEGGVIKGKKGKRGKEKILFYRKGEVKIPARTFVYMTEKDWEEIVEMVKSWVRE